MASSTDGLNGNVELLNFLNILFAFDSKNCCSVFGSKMQQFSIKFRT